MRSQRTEQQELCRQKLRELGAEIRKRGIPQGARHGEHWKLVLPNKIWFYHDDYNHAVTMYLPDGTTIYFGCDWGGFTGERTLQEYQDAINAVVLTNYEEAHDEL